jgi:hypothetical protein
VSASLRRSQLLIAGCSRRKTATTAPLPALELYQGGCIPSLRARVGTDPQLRSRIRILSAEHGLIPADTPLLPYDRPLDAGRAAQLRPAVARALAHAGIAAGMPREVLVIAGPLYQALLAEALPPGVPATWIRDPYDWPSAAAVLDLWGWP